MSYDYFRRPHRILEGTWVYLRIPKGSDAAEYRYDNEPSWSIGDSLSVFSDRIPALAVLLTFGEL
jgi:hypothetical protein